MVIFDQIEMHHFLVNSYVLLMMCAFRRREL